MCWYVHVCTVDLDEESTSLLVYFGIGNFARFALALWRKIWRVRGMGRYLCWIQVWNWWKVVDFTWIFTSENWPQRRIGFFPQENNFPCRSPTLQAFIWGAKTFFHLYGSFYSYDVSFLDSKTRKRASLNRLGQVRLLGITDMICARATNFRCSFPVDRTQVAEVDFKHLLQPSTRRHINTTINSSTHQHSHQLIDTSTTINSSTHQHSHQLIDTSRKKNRQLIDTKHYSIRKTKVWQHINTGANHKSKLRLHFIRKS
jgi:hypothetical protein